MQSGGKATGGRGQGSGRGRMGGNRPGVGPVGNCVCPSCGKKLAHKAGVPCYSLKCPECGTRMVRQ
jgi:hypothetical protein